MIKKLDKGGKAEIAGNVISVRVGFSDASEIEIDREVFLLDRKGRLPDHEHLIFARNRNFAGIEFVSDDMFYVHPAQIPSDVHKLAFTASITKAYERGQNFGMVEKAFVLVENICRFDMEKAVHGETAVILAEIYRYRDGWRFSAVGQGFKDGLKPLAVAFGIDVD